MKVASVIIASVCFVGVTLLVIWAGWLLATDDADGGRHPMGAIMLALGVAGGCSASG